MYNSGEEFLIDNDTLLRRRNLKRGVLDITGLVSEDCTEQFFLGSRVCFAFRCDFSNQYVAFLDFSTDTDDTVLIEILDGIVADIGDITCEFLSATLSFTHLGSEFLDMDGGENILAHDTLGNHYGVLEVITLPRHKGHHHVATQSQFTALCGIAFAEYLSLADFVALAHNWTQVDGSTVISTLIFCEFVFFKVFLKTDEALGFGTLVTNDNLGGVDILDNTISLRVKQHTAILSHRLLYTSTHQWNLWVKQWHSLAHHVRTHKGTVGIVVFKERDKRCSNRGNLV